MSGTSAGARKGWETRRRSQQAPVVSDRERTARAHRSLINGHLRDVREGRLSTRNTESLKRQRASYQRDIDRERRKQSSKKRKSSAAPKTRPSRANMIFVDEFERDVVLEMERNGTRPALRDRWMQGYELGKRIRAEKRSTR